MIFYLSVLYSCYYLCELEAIAVSVGLITGARGEPGILKAIIFSIKKLLATPVLQHEKLSSLSFCSLMEDQTRSVYLFQEKCKQWQQKYPLHSLN